MRMTNFYKFVPLFLLVSLFLMVGYSNTSTVLLITGDAYIRVDSDLRISDLKLISSDSGAYEKSSTYTKYTTNFDIVLPSSSSLTYQVTIKNNTGKYFSPNQISVDNFNSYISYTMDNFVEYGLYQGSSYTFNIIIFSNSDSLVEGKLDFNYNLNTFSEKTSFIYDYSGEEEVLDLDYNARYKLEVWGAQGGSIVIDSNNSPSYNVNLSLDGGYGGYSYGVYTLDTITTSNRSNTKFYINVGGEGTAGGNYDDGGIYTAGGYNGGGGNNSGSYGTGSTGGGATHIAMKSGLLSSLEDDKGVYYDADGTYDSNVILIVAGGGGGAGSEYTTSRYYIPGCGGGISGSRGESHYDSVSVGSTPGSQNAGYKFGLGSTGYSWQGGGGGGFFGGTTQSTGAGGSGYIGNKKLSDKIMYCFDCDESNNLSTKTVSTTGTSTLRDTINCSDGYSSDAISNCAKKGNGYARITIQPLN